MSTTPDFLFGTWKTDCRPIEHPPEDGDVVIAFNPDWSATFAVFFRDHRDVTKLAFQAKAERIIFTQPGKQTTTMQYEHLTDGSLKLWIDGKPARFLKHI